MEKIKMGERIDNKKYLDEEVKMMLDMLKSMKESIKKRGGKI